MRRALTVRLILLLAFSAIAVAVAAFGYFSWRDASPERIVEAQLAGRRFIFAQSYARDGGTTAGGMTDRLAFVASFPTFKPPAPNARSGPATIAVTLTPKDDAQDPAERPSNLYARFLAEDTENGPAGLIMRRFEANSPYDLELLYLAPPDGHGFFARCPKPGAGIGDKCLSIFRDGTIDVELRYAPALLDHWDALYPGVRNMIARMAPRAKKTR